MGMPPFLRRSAILQLSRWDLRERPHTWIKQSWRDGRSKREELILIAVALARSFRRFVRQKPLHGGALRVSLCIALLLAGVACQRTTANANWHTRVARGATDSLESIYVAYYRKRITAAVAAKAIVEEKDRSHADWTAELDDSPQFPVDDSLRTAIERELRARGRIPPARGDVGHLSVPSSPGNMRVEALSPRLPLQVVIISVPAGLQLDSAETRQAQGAVIVQTPALLAVADSVRTLRVMVQGTGVIRLLFDSSVAPRQTAPIWGRDITLDRNAEGRFQPVPRAHPASLRQLSHL